MYKISKIKAIISTIICIAIMWYIMIAPAIDILNHHVTIYGCIMLFMLCMIIPILICFIVDWISSGETFFNYINVPEKVEGHRITLFGKIVLYTKSKEGVVATREKNLNNHDNQYWYNPVNGLYHIVNDGDSIDREVDKLVTKIFK